MTTEPGKGADYGQGHLPPRVYGLCSYLQGISFVDMRVSLSIVSKGLGHENLKTTQIYLSPIDTEGVVKANRQLIGKIFRK